MGSSNEASRYAGFLGDFYGDTFGGGISSGGWGGDALGRGAQKDANNANRDRYYQTLGLIRAQRPEIEASYAKQRESLLDAKSGVEGAYKKSTSAISTLGKGGRKTVADSGVATSAGSSRTLAAAGLGSNSRSAGLARSVAADTARGTQAVNEQQIGAQANLDVAQGERIARIRALIGNSYTSENSALNDWRKREIGVISSREDVGGSGWIGDIMGALGAFSGGFSGSGGTGVG